MSKGAMLTVLEGVQDCQLEGVGEGTRGRGGEIRSEGEEGRAVLYSLAGQDLGKH